MGIDRSLIDMKLLRYLANVITILGLQTIELGDRLILLGYHISYRIHFT
jgi:hypothetical protein